MKVIIDCDTGNDDAWAIISLLRAESISDYKVIAITCVNGNTTVDHSALNSLLVLKTADRLDIPVYKGAPKSLLGIQSDDYEPFHGTDGFGMIYHESEKPSKDLIKEKHAVEAMKELIDQNAGDITIIAIGPLTNVALLYKLHPGISSKISNIYIMGGNHLGVGNNVSNCAEFNFWNDPESVHIVLNETLCQIYIFPWEPCIEAGVGMSFNEWRIKVLSSNNNQYTKLLDPVEIKAYGDRDRPNWRPCDCFLASCFIKPDLIGEMKQHHVMVELHGGHTRGQLVFDRFNKKTPNAFIIESINVEKFKQFMMWVCHHDVELL